MKSSSIRIHLFILLLLSLIISIDAQNETSKIDDVEDVLTSEKTPTREPIRVTKGGVTSSKAPSDDASFQSDCSDPYNKDIVCSVHSVDCDDHIFEYVNVGNEPPEAHDVRVEPFAKVIGRNQLNRLKHRLHVDVSWQMPPQNSSAYLRAFKLQIEGENKSNCFVFNVTQHSYDTSSPRYRFSSPTMFEFGRNYTVTIYSLPRSANKAPRVTKTSAMPEDPDVIYENHNNMTEYCKTHSHPQASKWTAGFRKIFLLGVAKTIQIEFVAAPPQYCFEEYEVRLLDGSGLELLHSAIVRADELKTELFNGKSVQFGEYNFTDLTLDTDYIPSVIPVESAEDGRCLCPTLQNTACSCIAADWKTVRLSKIEKPKTPTNRTVQLDIKLEKPAESYWHLYALIFALLVLILVCSSAFLALFCYRKFAQKKEKTVRIRCVSDEVAHAYPHNGATMTSPLIFNQKASVLILYSHDCAQHEQAVVAFADLLSNVFGLDVHLDVWEEDEIEANIAEYVNSSIVRADKVIVINSVGAYHRVASRQTREPAVERVVPGPNDGLFLQQIDLALQHVRIISVRFSYTPSGYTLFALSPLLQYTVPDNLNLLVASICDCGSKTDTRLAGFSAELARLHAAASRMAQFTESDPKWFEKSHHRLPAARAPLPLPHIVVASESPVTMDTSVLSEDDERIDDAGDVVDESEHLLESCSQGTDVEVDVDENQEAIPIRIPKEVEDPSHFDSAYVSGSDFSAQMDAPIAVNDKPRLEAGKMRDSTMDSAFVDDSGLVVS